MHDPEVTTDQIPGRDTALAPDGLSCPPRYRYVGEIARGGMGVVLRVVDVDLDRPLALKTLLTRSQDEPQPQERFLAEARVTGQLQHPGVPPVHEVGRLPDGRPFFSMKLVVGRTLAALLGERPTPQADLLRFLKIFEQVCQTVAYAHSRGVIHRDLKPLNVMVGAFGEVQVMDWGLAKELARGKSPHAQQITTPAAADVAAVETAGWIEGQTTDALERTAAGQVLGTLSYLPPEQANAWLDRLDARADVFGLGAILCEILTGKPPYLATTVVELLRQAREADLTDALARLDACGADAALIALARGYLAADPADRPADAGVAAGQITAYLNSVQERLRQAELERAAANARAGAERTKRRWQLALAGVLGLALLAGAAGALWYARDQAARTQRRERLTAEVKAHLHEAALHRQALHARLDDRLEAQKLLSDVDGWKAQVDQTWNAWRRADTVRGAGEGLLEQELHEQRQLIEADEADWKTARQFDEIQLDASTLYGGLLKQEVAAAKYAAVFVARGLDVNGEPASVARQVRSMKIRTALVAALDHWVTILPKDDPLVGRLLEVARLADPDPLGDQVRDQKTWSDRAKLLALASRGVSADVSGHLVILLASKVNTHDNEAAVALLRRAILDRPRDFWLPFILGNVVQDVTERVGCYQTALALRPTNVAAQYNLGHTLYARRDYDGAIACFERVLQLDPKSASAHNGLGAVLLARGDVAGALRYFRAGLELAPDHSLLLYNTGVALKDQGKYAEALSAFEKSRDLEAKQPTWRVPAAEKVKECKRLAEMEQKLPAILAGEASPRDAAERLDLARVCNGKLLYASAARFTAVALTDDPRLAGGWGRYNVACYAAQAAAGLGKDAPTDEADRASLRRLAMTWLDLELSSLKQQLQVTPKVASEVEQKMRHWQKDADLTSVRDDAQLAKLPESERREWRRLWGEVATLGKK